MREKYDLKDLYKQWIVFLAILKVDLYNFQEEMVGGLLTLPDYADCTQTRQSGKSFVLALLIYFLAYYLKWSIIIVAPKLEQTDRIMSVVRKIAWYLKTKKRIRHNVLSMTKIQITNKGSIYCVSGDPFSQSEGHHAHLVVLDEKHQLQRDHITSKIIPFRGFFNGIIWSLGIGGDPDSWGELSRKRAAEAGNFLWNCPHERVTRDKPEYRLVAEDARKDMMPVEFDAHYGCMPLDMSKHILIAKIDEYLKLPEERAKITIALDFGSIDHTVATVSHRVGNRYYWQEWMVINGDYSIQYPAITKWVNEEVEYDELLGEYNGVGRACVDELRGHFGLDICPIDVDGKMKTDLAHRMKSLADQGNLLYNPNSEYSSVFYNKITKLKYRMTNHKDVKVDHCDFYSSGILTLLEAPQARLSA